MLFPNHPAFAELRPGMGYAPGARSMGYAPGARAMGDLSTSEKNLAVDAGIDTSDIDLLDSLGATDQDMQNLINGNTTLAALYAKYGVSISSATATATDSTPASSAPAGQSPPGSTLLYTASYNPVSGWTTASSAIQALAPLLPAHGMALQSSQVSSSGLLSNASFSVTVMDSVGHALITDAQSVLDALLNQITNNGKISSTLTMVSPGTTASGQPAPSLSTDPISFLENNGLYIALGIGGLILLNNFTGKRR